MATNEKRPLTLVIDEDLWDRWKLTVPKFVSLNEAVVNLIKADLEAFTTKKRGAKK